jgi:hypothetical protein
MRAVACALAVLALAACAAAPDPDPTVAVHLRNDGARPLQCRLLFGHWVDRDLGVLAPGAETGFTIQQSPKDGALYIMRSDGARRMMIENLFCAEPGKVETTMGQLDLAPARSARMRRIDGRCAAATAGGRVDCSPVTLTP